MGNMGKLSVSVCAVSKALGSAVYIEVVLVLAGTDGAGGAGSVRRIGQHRQYASLDAH